MPKSNLADVEKKNLGKELNFYFVWKQMDC